MPPKFPLLAVRSRPPPNLWFLGPTGLHPKLHVDVDQVSPFSAAIFSPYTAQWGETCRPQNCPFPWGDPGPHLVHGSLAPPESISQTASQLIFHFCRADGCVQQTDRQCYINSNRLHIMLCIAMQPNNNNKLLQYWQ